ncbi:4-(cytidine 5'-diphospho)-2-C-methyl-D-erythritol kinase [Leptospira langatensis]|uniref:4-diphosphocytidyl-2-C-methyl-D-erythritol kinase n=1 Tax=Leptospira langatensis TaxID=2484983 RepID=A0A5F1ZV18_9LEPT|nr:4-(cytidine 5'-diphospho)-2-C-methyl-D-erythritol kinase [Leptospira langatensis]TGK01273.1 4-(cytidine 5'-diphospho)-2-C-methyl-D-erythritol kinase [Leptospira langatensis]TGL42274.1 4-(cytidine 5'-diphospho)-2-C-methyl-D-erythritol kinase [Leptospira langatensis]
MLSPAKINLGLEIPYKRPDGFHEIRSVFLRLNWGDDIGIEPIDPGRFELVSENQIILEKRRLYDEVSEKGDLSKNILFKTFTKVRTHYRELPGVRIHLTKKIPPAAGLGGGSTNAASLLSFYFGLGPEFHSDELLRLAAEIGADVPFFLSEGNAFVSGKGEIMREIEVHSGQGILALTPQVLSTAEMYAGLKKPLQADPPSKKWISLREDVEFALKEGNWAALRGKLVNDFEPLAFQKFPELGKLKESLLANGASYSSLTGSGSCIYGLVQGLEIREELLAKMQTEFPDLTFVSFNY